MENRLSYRKLRAPKPDGETLQDPSFSRFGETLLKNRQSIARHCFQLSGRSICEVQRAARRELVTLAAAYSGADAASFAGKPNLILSGHQPTLFHPGVWLKNFALDSLARKHQAVSVNLVIDNDLSGLPGINVPTGSLVEPKLKLVKFDSYNSQGPFETEKLSDPDLFESFADRVSETIAPFVEQPLVKKLWPHVLESLETTNNPALAIASGRHRLEREFGLNNLEIPLSRICETESFALFVTEIVSRADELRTIYNDSLTEYRKLHRIRSSAHPVPSLKQVDDWIELPFWIWTDQPNQRSPLFVAKVGDAVHLSDGGDLRHKLSQKNLLQAIRQLPEAGIRLRPRALMTTMYSRLVLGDAFLHGIGGAKYDQLTDQIMHRMFGVDPPQFNTVTGTFWLPVQMHRVSSSDMTVTRGQFREMRFHPEQFIETSSPYYSLVEEKRDLLALRPPQGSRQSWHARLDETNLKLFASLKSERSRLNDQLGQQSERWAASKLLSSREFSFCLFGDELIGRLKSAVE